jgi:hypothetical protein
MGHLAFGLGAGEAASRVEAKAGLPAPCPQVAEERKKRDAANDRQVHLLAVPYKQKADSPHHRKMEKQSSVPGKKKKAQMKLARRAQEMYKSTDNSHGGENHLQTLEQALAAAAAPPAGKSAKRARSSGAAVESDDGTTMDNSGARIVAGGEDVQDDSSAPKKARKSSCSVCSSTSHTVAGCPHNEFRKPPPPLLDMHLGMGEVIILLDTEFDSMTGKTFELGAVTAVYTEGVGWELGSDEFKVVFNERVTGWCMANCKRLSIEAMSKQAKPFEEGIRSFGDFITAAGGKHVMAHNAIASDVTYLLNHAEKVGVDFLKILRDCGVKTIVDTARVIPEYGIKKLQPEGRGGKGGYLKNDALYSMATTSTMKDQGLTAHRALDDAKAERVWVTKLPEVGAAFFGDSPRLKCGISLEAVTRYHEQYKKHRRFREGLEGRVPHMVPQAGH